VSGPPAVSTSSSSSSSSVPVSSASSASSNQQGGGGRRGGRRGTASFCASRTGRNVFDVFDTEHVITGHVIECTGRVVSTAGLFPASAFASSASGSWNNNNGISVFFTGIRAHC
jgi:hypothetical protein